MNALKSSLHPPAVSHEETFATQLHHVRIGLIRHLEALLATSGLGLNFSQFRVLKKLGEHGSIIASDLARSLEHDPGALTRLLDRLQDQGLVCRQPRQDDRRAVDVCLTDKGKETFEQMRWVAKALNDAALADLSEEERKVLMSLFARVRTTLEK